MVDWVTDPGMGEADRWDRNRLLRTLLVVAVVGVILLGGLGYAVYGAVTSPGRPQTPTPVAAGQAGQQLAPGQARRDAIAAAPMLAVPPEAARGGTPAVSPGPAIAIPAAGRLGPARVPTGYPRTPEGAVGQLAVIETTVLQNMSIETARTVYAAWSAPEAPPVQTWELITNIQAFTASGAGRYAGDLRPAITAAAVVATPVAGQVKGVDGPDWVVACVLLQVTARAATSARVAYGHCSRMQWTTTPDSTGTTDGTDSSDTTETSATPGALGTNTTAGHGRWVIGAGPAPVRAPSTWPGTDLAGQAGWRTWAPGVGGE